MRKTRPYDNNAARRVRGMLRVQIYLQLQRLAIQHRSICKRPLCPEYIEEHLTAVCVTSRTVTMSRCCARAKVAPLRPHRDVRSILEVCGIIDNAHDALGSPRSHYATINHPLRRVGELWSRGSTSLARPTPVSAHLRGPFRYIRALSYPRN